jgi:hypothetical protein
MLKFLDVSACKVLYQEVTTVYIVQNYVYNEDVKEIKIVKIILTKL